MSRQILHGNAIATIIWVWICYISMAWRKTAVTPLLTQLQQYLRIVKSRGSSHAWTCCLKLQRCWCQIVVSLERNTVVGGTTMFSSGNRETMDLFQYLIRCFIVRSHAVAKPQDLKFALLNHRFPFKFDRGISCSATESRDLKTLWDLTITQLMILKQTQVWEV